ARELESRLLDFARRRFAPVRELALTDVLRLRDAGEVTASLAALAREAVPLLRTSFDELGGGAYAQPLHYTLLGEPGALPSQALAAGGLGEGETLITGDRCCVACCRLRHFIPLAAVRDLVGRGRACYERLSVAERERVHAFSEWASHGSEDAGSGTVARRGRRRGVKT
ncbi:MAG: hypothetical protein QME94_20005, partial [Anaerolineae bacterium]|nr:hypothetical protein [Anaerolineae bacterium]